MRLGAAPLSIGTKFARRHLSKLLQHMCKFFQAIISARARRHDCHAIICATCQPMTDWNGNRGCTYDPFASGDVVPALAHNLDAVAQHYRIYLRTIGMGQNLLDFTIGHLREQSTTCGSDHQRRLFSGCYNAINVRNI